VLGDGPSSDPPLARPATTGLFRAGGLAEGQRARSGRRFHTAALDLFEPRAHVLDMRRRRMGRQFLGSSIARAAMAGLFREMVDAFSANRRAVLAPKLAAIRAALGKGWRRVHRSRRAGRKAEKRPATVKPRAKIAACRSTGSRARFIRQSLNGKCGGQAPQGRPI